MRLLSWLRKVWFPTTLLVLALLAIPGLVLVILTLCDLDTPVNDWLQANAQISYQLALSPWLTLLLLLLPPIVVLLYFLKLRRQPMQVPSTFLWKKSIEDLRVNTLFQWLRQNVLLVLQILALLFLIYSVLGLRFHGGANPSRHYILLIDNSASMSATDVSPNRLDWAKDEALKEIDAAGDNDFGMVIVFNSKATTLQTYTNNRPQLRDVVRSIQPTARSTRIDEALSLAESLANPIRSTEDVASQPDDVNAGQERTMVQPRGIAATVHLFSDGRFAKLSEVALSNLASRQAGNFSVLGNLQVNYHCAGKFDPGHANNLAVVGLTAVRHAPPNKRAELEAQKLQVLVRIMNFRKTATKVVLKVDTYVDSKLIHPEQKTLELDARVLKKAGGDEEDSDTPGLASMTFLLPPLDLHKNILLHAYLEGAKDDFPLDDQAWLALGTGRKAKVLWIGGENRALSAFFDQDATKRLATVERLAEKELTTDSYRQQARRGDIDLVIFDRCTPVSESDMPLANTLFIDRPPPPWQRGTQTMRNPLPVPSRQAHPLLRHITTFWEVRVAEAFAFDVLGNLPEALQAEAKLPDSDANKRNLPSVMRIVETGGSTEAGKKAPPLIFSMGRGAYTDVVLAFGISGPEGDLLTDWPLQPSFPLFFRNVLYSLGKVDDAVRVAGVQAGEPIVLRPEAGVQKLRIVAPNRSASELPKQPQRSDFVFAETNLLGTYSYETDPGDGTKRNFTVNLLDPEESNIEPRFETFVGKDRVVAGQDRTQPRELWKWGLLLVVLLLMIEWTVYTRRISI